MHLLVADDHRLVLDALKLYLKRLRSDITVTEAMSFDEAIERLEAAGDVDLVLLDLQMPGMNDLDGLSALKERFPALPVVILSGTADAAKVEEALSKGAAGFVPKGLGGKTMLEALDRVLSGEVFAPTVASGAAGESDDPPPSAPERRYAAGNPLNHLTAQEEEVLALLVKGYPNREIARALALEVEAVDAHLKSIYRKIDVPSRTQAVTKALRLGWTV